MRIQLGDTMHYYGSRSYLDAADDIVGLPMHELVRMTRSNERNGWPEDCPPDRVPELLHRLYGLASQI